jgi:hypothetical protein
MKPMKFRSLLRNVSVVCLNSPTLDEIFGMSCRRSASFTRHWRPEPGHPRRPLHAERKTWAAHIPGCWPPGPGFPKRLDIPLSPPIPLPAFADNWPALSYWRPSDKLKAVGWPGSWSWMSCSRGATSTGTCPVRKAVLAVQTQLPRPGENDSEARPGAGSHDHRALGSP